MRVIVVGAGLGGLTLAQGLREVGIDVVVAERDGPDGRPQGISLHLDDRGTTALRACLPPAHFEMVRATLGGARERPQVLSEVDGRLVVTEADPARSRPGRQAHRPLLRAILLTGLDDVVRFGAEFVRSEQLVDGRVRAWFADGSSEVGDVLVGADGIGSAVRRQHLPDVPVADTGRRMLMGATPLRVAGGIPALIGDDATQVRVRGTTMALGVLRFGEPPAAARERLLPAMCTVDAEDYVMWALPTRQEPTGQVSAAGSTRAWHRARELVEVLPPPLGTIVERAWPERTVELRIGTIPPDAPRSIGPVTLIGDAIRAAPGLGANLAMQDAHQLREVLVRITKGERDLLGAPAA